MQLRFTSFAVVYSREDFHLQDCAHAGRTTQKPAEALGRLFCVAILRYFILLARHTAQPNGIAVLRRV
jgi:hypothetical protein